MNGQWAKKKGHHIYRCLKGCCSISGPLLDAYIGQLLTALWTERAVAVIPETQPFTQQADLDHWKSELEQVEKLYTARELSLTEKLASERAIQGQLAPLEKAWTDWVRATAAPAPRHTVDQWEKAKAKGDVAAMRRMARAELERVDIAKAARPGLKGLQADRVTPVWRPSSGASGNAQSLAQEQTGHAA